MRNSPEQWKAGIFIALGLHFSVLAAAVFAPDLFHSARRQEQVYTVKLFEPVKQKTSRAAPAPKKLSRHIVKEPVRPKMPPAPAKTKPARPANPKPSAVKKNPASHAVKPVAVSKPVKKTVPPKKAVSLNPAQKKPEHKTASKKKSKPHVVKKRTEPAKKNSNEKKKSAATPNQDDLLAQKLAAIERQVKEREEDARLKARIAALARKVRGKSGTGGRARKQAGTSGFSSNGHGRKIDVVIARYGMIVSQRIWRRWNLPTQLLDQKGLEAIIEIQIAEDGRILATRFEKSSGNMLFDRSAMRAVKDASPVAALPVQLRPGPLVMGIRFRPEDM